jgi:hypothetical protein
VTKQAEKTEESEEPEEEQPTFTFTPAEGDPIVMPPAAVLWETVDGKGATEFLWEVRRMNETYQTFEFLDRAKVPMDVQRRIVQLSIEERRQLLKSWFDEVNRPPTTGELPPES